ncbi:hydrogen peroxide-inducible genes activator [Coralliovum pocilloporae]|uniref:hydrogen peroxide-inducible genes activator n=1 Tax=Coralliovum pocilloporae TaxID=3066369 RepID=UPI00330720E0
MAQDITLRQLRYFVALADTRHFRKAAEQIGVSQPSLSQQIVGLEAALGLDLVERGRRGAVLTPGGRDVLEQARVILDDIEGLKTSAQGAREGISGTLRLGSTPTLGPYFLPQVMRRIHQAYPSLKVIVRDAAPAVLKEELLQGRHDFILTQLPFRSADVAVQRLFREPLVLAVAQDHALARQSDASDDDLSGQDVLTLSKAYTLHDQIASLCDELGAHLRSDYEGTSLDAIRHMVALNMGVSFLPALYAKSEVPKGESDVAVLRFRKNQLTRSIGMVWRKRSPHGGALKRLTRIVKDVARENFSGQVTVE